MFARIGTVTDFTAGTLKARIKSDVLLPLQLQPQIFSHLISSISAVARSPRRVTPFKGPAKLMGGGQAVTARITARHRPRRDRVSVTTTDIGR
jgi:hypothetical protein